VDGDRIATTVLDGDILIIIVQNISFQLLPGRLQWQAIVEQVWGCSTLGP